jgi:stage V sporulation protein G
LLAPNFATRGLMDITEVKVFPVDEDKLKAYITIVLDNCFVVRDLKIISGNGGLFVAMPSKRRKDGTFKDIAHPLNQSTRATMEKKILDAYLSEIKKTGGDASTPPRAVASSGGDAPDDGLDG